MIWDLYWTIYPENVINFVQKNYKFVLKFFFFFFCAGQESEQFFATSIIFLGKSHTSLKQQLIVNKRNHVVYPPINERNLNDH